MVVSTTSCRRLAQPLLGANVYISAGSLRRHGSILMDLLQRTQDRCSQQTTPSNTKSDNNNTNDDGVCVVVHAFSDAVYNRSSIHLAGNEVMLASVVADLVREAQESLLEDEKAACTSSNDNEQTVVHHPFVGLVDHVSIMPLVGAATDANATHAESTPGIKTATVNTDNNENIFEPTTAWGRTARAIGGSMKLSNSNTEVFYYGSADPNNTPLAEVRRSKTKFFQSGGLDQVSTPKTTSNTASSNQTVPIHKTDIATVGAPSDFVENFNVRLTRNCTKSVAQSLTRFLRERDGGLPGLEVLTLPYSNDRYEAACNLLQPKVGSAEAIQDKIEEWAANVIAKNKQSGDGIELDLDYFVDQSYRVGTTADECLSALDLVSQSNTIALEEHNLNVQTKLKGYLSTL